MLGRVDTRRGRGAKQEQYSAMERGEKREIRDKVGGRKLGAHREGV